MSPFLPPIHCHPGHLVGLLWWDLGIELKSSHFQGKGFINRVTALVPETVCKDRSLGQVEYEMEKQTTK